MTPDLAVDTDDPTTPDLRVDADDLTTPGLTVGTGDLTIPDLAVDTADLRRLAVTLAGTADRVTGAAAQAPPLQPVPRWATAGAAASATDVARAQLTRLGADLAETARRLTVAAAGYEAADTRAAHRLRSAR